jgi:Ca2+-binding RTX toxin-like protein
VYYVGTQDLELTNSGILDGRSFAFYSDAGTSEDSLTNHGTMMGKVVTGAGADLMRNWSRIEGDLMMGGGNDSVYNYGQIHAVDLGEGDDLYFASGAEATAYVVDGGAGADSFVPGAAAEEIYGGDGRDQISFTAATIGVVVDLTLPLANGGAAAGDRYFEIENVFGSRYADRIRGSVQANRLVAGDGADSLIGLGGGDVLNGEAGHDAIDGGDGNDTLNGGAGNDQLVGAEGADALRGQDGADTMSGGAGIDRLTGGTGNDAFVFARPVEGGDVITDFGIAAGNNDLFLIDASVFGFGAASGELAAGQFRTRGVNEAVDADDRFIFRTTDRTLWFDRDGSGEVAPLLVADLQAGAVVTAEDILLV